LLRLGEPAALDRLDDAKATRDEGITFALLAEGKSAKPLRARSQAEEEHGTRRGLHQHTVLAQHTGIDIDEPTLPPGHATSHCQEAYI